MRLFFPRCRTVHLPLGNSEGSSLPISPTYQNTSDGLHRLLRYWPLLTILSSLNLLRRHSTPSSKLLMTKLNNTEPSIELWGTPLMTGLKLDSVPRITTPWDLPFNQLPVPSVPLSTHPTHIS